MSSVRMVKFLHRNSINLLFVCRQIYSETALLPYKLNTFVINCYHPRSIATFLNRRTSAQIKLMLDVTGQWAKRKPRRNELCDKRMSASEWLMCLRTQGDTAAEFWV